MIDRIKEVLIPKDKEKGLYRITFVTDEYVEYYADLTKTQFEIAKLEEKFMHEGMNPSDLETYKSLIRQDKEKIDSYND
jgi:hypothetical protein